MLQNYASGAHWRVQFESLSEMVDWTRATPRVWSQKSSSSEPATNSWDLGAGYVGALKLAQEGWEAGIKNIAALAMVVPNNTITTKEMSVAGDYPDVPRYLAGDPFNMVKRGKQRVPKPAMTIVVNTVASASVKAKAMANYGAAMVALVDRLESRGIRVELLGAVSYDNLQRGKATVAWTIKRAEDHLDLASIAFSLAHPACFRRLSFAAIERSPRELECWSYGVPGSIKASHLLDCPEDALCIDGVQHNPGACDTMPGALAFAKNQINKAAGEAIVELEDLDD